MSYQLVSDSIWVINIERVIVLIAVLQGLLATDEDQVPWQVLPEFTKYLSEHLLRNDSLPELIWMRD